MITDLLHSVFYIFLVMVLIPFFVAAWAAWSER